MASPYPVILTLENHCNDRQKEVIARLLRQTLGHLLFVPDGRPVQFLSPEDLKFKVVLR